MPWTGGCPQQPPSCSRGGFQFKIKTLDFDVYIQVPKQEGGVSSSIVSTDITNTVSRVMPESFCHLAQFDYLRDLNSPSLQNEMDRSKLPLRKILWSVLIHLSLKDFASIVLTSAKIMLQPWALVLLYFLE